MKIIIDRFEGEYAVVELDNGTTVDMPKILLPDNACEGSIINIICDDKETENRKKIMKDKMNNLFHK